MPHCRCRHCDHRRTLTQRQFDTRPPKCICGKRDWRQDKYRANVELKRRPCRCVEYSFPHRRASGFCEHNTKMCVERRRIRFEEGSYA